jgi:glutathione peroxidase
MKLLLTKKFINRRWNFAKFLIDAKGNPYKRYSPQTDPDDIIPDIEELLRQKESETN